MSIRARFMITFISLVFFGVMSISTFAILFVRDHLLRSSRDNLDQQARFLTTLLSERSDTTAYRDVLSGFVRYTSYRVELLDAQFLSLMEAGTLPDSVAATFSGIAPVVGPPAGERMYIRITASESDIQATLARVRYIIYAGIFLTLLVTAGVSWVAADRLTLPIRDLAEAARGVASGSGERLRPSERGDEIGDLSRDVAAMAGRLRDDIDDLRRLNKAQEDFIAALSHEVRNPLFSARGYLEMALEGEGQSGQELDREELLKLVQKSHRNLIRVHDLFADMLMLVRLEFEREPLDLGAVPLAPLVQELEETFLPMARERGLQLVLESGDAIVNGQKDLLKVSLSNLLSNALRHTEKGEVRLSVEAINGSVRLTISDTGIGIDSQHLGHIFEKFYRVDKARSRDEGGTGLGLALVQQAMKALGSRIEVASEPGKGSRFWFELPEVG